MPLLAANLLLVATQAGGLVASIYNPIFWANFDAAAIRANGSRDTLLSTFHRQRATWRLAVALSIALLSSLPALLVSAKLAILLFLAQVSFNLFYFFSEFNPRLNDALALPYKGRWYVSWNPAGSRFDRFLWRRAWRLQGNQPPPINGPSAPTQAIAAEELRHLSTFVKWLSYMAYILFAIAGYSLSYGF